MAIFFLIALFVAQWYLSLAAQSIFHHRYAAHGMFALSKRGEYTWHVFSFVAMGPSYLSPYVYGVLHRMHHAYADTEQDPHSPKYFDSPFGLFKMMWQTKRIYAEIDSGQSLPEPRFVENLPSWRSFDRFAGSWIVRIIWAGLYTWMYVALHAPWWLYPLLVASLIFGPLHGVIVNWCAHKYGHRAHDTDDTSTNLPWWVRVLVPGEGWHNNHHSRPGEPDFSKGSRGFDPYYWVLRAMGYVG